MDKDDEFATLVTNAVGLYILKRKEVSKLNEQAIRSAEKKINN